ncbi:MAG: Asp-tRNA(Asn)/Glu-tRNA(Gln) amidotransferase subunit GatC [Verrucomicrobia bacterium]|nr:Asp-tRNA(Asn)/Glu-tRNA(Gln) amidotransferase subunit GatC [Verrucomicrobiota bacterium]MBS0646100.1 Asp-tRNA(Asn)/Glu-tRNA(Gln) amidotransferase subunit GatC [Verrucomicrobiota bacterium]
MSELNKDQLTALARLCRLELNQEELTRLSSDFQKIVNYVALLDMVETSDLSPYSHMQEQSFDTLRDDKVQEPLSRADFLANAPDHVGGMIRVPTVIHHVPKNS